MKMNTSIRILGGLALVAMSATIAVDSRPGEAAPAKAGKKKSAAKPSGAPSAAIVAQKMRELWVRPAAEGMDGATTVTVHSVQIGAPRNWSILDGGGGRPGAKVWPAKVHWTYRTHYRTRTEVRERRWSVSCFKDGFGDWVVQSNGERKTETKREEPSTMK